MSAKTVTMVQAEVVTEMFTAEEVRAYGSSMFWLGVGTAVAAVAAFAIVSNDERERRYQALERMAPLPQLEPVTVGALGMHGSLLGVRQTPLRAVTTPATPQARTVTPENIAAVVKALEHISEFVAPLVKGPIK